MEGNDKLTRGSAFVILTPVSGAELPVIGRRVGDKSPISNRRASLAIQRVAYA